MVWLRILEAWLTTRLLASPAFHRLVQNIHKGIRQMRHGPDLEEMGGTKIDKPNNKNFLEHYLEEIKDQFRGGSSQKK
ncbi:hypothetical protein N7G274_007834 [Stereocaulon virgatum]|uniref:Uncharacterized protein n=1 Tax=Stereocaulon virgatum TaxID=373712 RepID=A0ABR4A0V1_9LECA